MEKIVSSLSGVNKSVFLLDDQTLKIVRYSNGFSKTQKVKSEDVVAISEITHTRLIERHGKFLLCELHIESIKSRVIIDFRPSEIDVAKELVRYITPEIKNTSLDDQKPENLETLKTVTETEISEPKQNDENCTDLNIIGESDARKTEIAEPQQNEENTLMSDLQIIPELNDFIEIGNQVELSQPSTNKTQKDEEEYINLTEIEFPQTTKYILSDNWLELIVENDGTLMLIEYKSNGTIKKETEFNRCDVYSIKIKKNTKESLFSYSSLTFNVREKYYVIKTSANEYNNKLLDIVVEYLNNKGSKLPNFDEYKIMMIGVKYADRAHIKTEGEVTIIKSIKYVSPEKITISNTDTSDGKYDEKNIKYNVCSSSIGLSLYSNDLLRLQIFDKKGIIKSDIVFPRAAISDITLNPKSTEDELSILRFEINGNRKIFEIIFPFIQLKDAKEIYKFVIAGKEDYIDIEKIISTLPLTNPGLTRYKLIINDEENTATIQCYRADRDIINAGVIDIETFFANAEPIEVSTHPLSRLASFGIINGRNSLNFELKFDQHEDPKYDRYDGLVSYTLSWEKPSDELRITIAKLEKYLKPYYDKYVEDHKEPPMSFSDWIGTSHEIKQANKLWNNAFSTRSSAEKMAKEIEKVQDHLTNREEKGIAKDALSCVYAIETSMDTMVSAFDGYMGCLGIQKSKTKKLSYVEFRDKMSYFVRYYDQLRSTYDQLYNDYSYLADYRRVKYVSYVCREEY